MEQELQAAMKAHGVPLDIVDMAGGDDIDTRVFDGIERRGCRARAQRSRVHSVMPAALLLLLLALPGAVCRSVFPGKDTLRRTPEESREIVWRWAEPKRSCDDACASYTVRTDGPVQPVSPLRTVFTL
jgi:hypothetical protein